MNPDEVQAISTNSDLYVVPIEGGTPQKITVNPGADSSPAYSPDGHYLAYRSQQRAGYESDRWRVMVLERATGKLSSPTDAIDRAVNSFIWSPDSKRIFFAAVDRGRQSIQFVPATGGGARAVVSGANMS
jgi:Tol biopolymer transport system component